MKIDLKKDRRDLYLPGSKDFVEVLVPPITYLAVDGHGDPNTSAAYPLAVQALYASAYAVKFALRARTGEDFVVGPLEGLWSSPDPTAFTAGRKQEWDWTMLSPLPGVVGDRDVEAGREAAARKKPGLDLSGVRVLDYDEGRSLQILHIGPYDTEAPTLARLHHEVMPAAGLAFNGRHHEIYLGDPRRASPATLRTVLRQPVTPIG
ncbi:GyrI-like domain-containing protein [Arthrobacter sp.]|uniref:GyrI-like domain-containing protein n=1 Tax=Arthrobacter sp. TaxID=1667 RepID=UPI003A915533